MKEAREKNPTKYWLGKKRPHSEVTKEKMRGRKHSEEEKEKIKLNNARYWLGKKLPEEIKQNMRISAFNRVLKNGTGISIGKNEKQLLDKQEQFDNCKIIRQFVIHPLGYIVDGYCVETNTIYEVYEKAHKNKTEKDIKRQNAIIEHLHCKFIIIWDK